MSGNGSSTFQFESGDALPTIIPTNTNSGLGLFNMQSRSVGGQNTSRVRRVRNSRRGRKSNKQCSRRTRRTRRTRN
jgi:hypothetical protein